MDNDTSPPRGTLNKVRWRQILLEAQHLLLEKGYQDTTISEVAARAGLLPGSLYYYIENKEDLLFQVLERANARHAQLLAEDPAITQGPALSRLDHFIDRHMALFHRDPRWNHLYERDQTFLTKEHQQALVDLRHETHAILREIIAAGVREGAIAGDVDPTMAAYSILGLMNTTIRWYQPAGTSAPLEVGQWIKRLLLEGLLRR